MVNEEFLHQITLFQDLDEKQSTLLLGVVKEVKFVAGETIIREGQAGSNLFVMCEGRIKIVREFDNQLFQLAELGPYDFFGEMALIDDFPASATVQAISDVVVLQLSRADFKALLSASTEISAVLWESLARNLNTKIRKTDDLVKMYYGLNKALCENEQFRELYASWNFSLPKN
jgi:CRP/FNR family transcriptional regulator, cyclic AMP receptor protein